MLFLFLTVLMYVLHITAKNYFATVCTCIKLTFLEGKYYYHTLKNRLTGTYHLYIYVTDVTPKIKYARLLAHELSRSKKKNV